MSDQPTPETDAAPEANVGASYINTGGPVESYCRKEFARTLERQRDEARRERDKMCEVILSERKEWHLAIADRDALRAELDAGKRERDDLKAEIEEYHQLTQAQSAILSGAAITLRGPEPKLTKWSHHDIGLRAAKAVSERDAALARVKELEKDWQQASDFAKAATEGALRLQDERDELRKALDTIANPRRGTEEEYWDVGQIGDFARAVLEKTKEKP